MKTKTLPYEAAAEFATRPLAGWFCLSCQNFWGDFQAAEHAARLCCAKDVPCKCGRARHVPTRTRCDQCDQDAETRWWNALPVAKWEGEFPLAMWKEDLYFWDAESLANYLGDCRLKEAEELTDEDLNAFRLVVCDRMDPPPFDISKHLEDFLGERGEIPAPFEKQINAYVNEWMKTNVPKAYIGSDRKLSMADLKAIVQPPTATPRKSDEVDEPLPKGDPI